eukprot:GEMP01008205.1.p1 GENE.GEMP01008205.1~~GEMP01008205.1.p1  ORF type:complete len:390 (+),score=69.44 GEMP01008205.1:79-1248(+)
MMNSETNQRTCTELNVPSSTATTDARSSTASVGSKDSDAADKSAHQADSEDVVTPPCSRVLCSLGTGEQVHILGYSAAEGKLEEFEFRVQECARCLYEFKNGITDVRVCHPRVGDVIFIITFLTIGDMNFFKEKQGKCMHNHLAAFVKDGATAFQDSGCLMPACHTLPSLINYLKKHVRGRHDEHDVAAVATEVGRWFPRRLEYEQYIHWDENDSTKYTRNLIFANEHMDVLLMCWPPHCESSIHCHSDSSCWVVLVEGEVTEVQYAMPVFDRQFLEAPAGTVGRCAKLKKLGEAKLDVNGVTTAFAANDIGLHKVVNGTDHPALTLHIYAPGLRSMKIFKECGSVSMLSMAAPPLMSSDGKKTGNWNEFTHPDGILDVDAWNNCCERP